MLVAVTFSLLVWAVVLKLLAWYGIVHPGSLSEWMVVAAVVMAGLPIIGNG